MQATTPTEVYDIFAKYFSAGTIDLLLTMYEDEAVMLPAPGQIATGKEQIREVLQNFLALNGDFRIEAPTVIQSGDVALLMAKWTLTGTGPDGGVVELAGQTADVVRRQEDGDWLFVIDNPYGAGGDRLRLG
jgi:uncharacterized protein (TIGR02246 family)